jgi:hypothetical protein
MTNGIAATMMTTMARSKRDSMGRSEVDYISFGA